MTVIGSLPNLEVLYLFETLEKDSTWNPVEGGFRQLKFLFVVNSRLRRWRAESIHFPKLEILILVCMYKLEEIPCGIGEIETLRIIDLGSCSISSRISAVEIWEEQQIVGNEDLQVFINGVNLSKVMLPNRLESFMTSLIPESNWHIG
ncbi:hypothetical protein BUALT_Bualt07G0029900 [Buddleja alternifolia]|uniref:Uncharacterized protein n=1 Tax=Buddleja alternifolia TaxID=168488 RepID=A0AAV6X8N2_9LAMI|nr:hypothetical protein BUALT_Bualt07G0029900 [Buddleja alternifolia]